MSSKRPVSFLHSFLCVTASCYRGESRKTFLDFTCAREKGGGFSTTATTFGLFSPFWVHLYEGRRGETRWGPDPTLPCVGGEHILRGY